MAGKGAFVHAGFVLQIEKVGPCHRGQQGDNHEPSRFVNYPVDVRAVAEDEGIPIYVISTAEVNNDPVSSAIFRRITTRTGGKAYFARTWQKQVEAFESIREDLGNSYTITYYPATNPNEGFRRINVEIVSDAAKKYRIRARPGYRPRASYE